ncbi:MAG: CRISPR-associated helicase Cas3' [Bacteroidales bacterium]|nr:CRISPR-associated helicase Cas3' [Bacteroidales bacterium]
MLHIINTHKLEFVIDNLINSLIQTFQTDNKLFSFFKTLFFNSIIYHDFGKINNKFQHVKMHNNNPKLKDIKHNQEAKHSVISAYLFSMHHLKNSEYLNLTDAEQTITVFIITCFAYPILRHHSSIIVDVPKDNSLDIEVIESLKGFLHLFSINIGKDEINELHEIISDTESSFAQLKELKIKIDFFPLFALLKLNWSLLTAADYYATTDYMNNIKTTDFGIINNNLREKIIANFATYKFNKDLFEKYDYYKNIDFSELKEVSRKNLNVLRQKLSVEVIENTRNNSDKRLFYLEAPTGAGKTNLSLAAAIELLKANANLNKIFYVFPFTTLVTQTFQSVKETLQIENNKIIQLHSKAGFHSKEEIQDGTYGSEKQNYIDNLFVNYPITLLTHVKFFDILKSNRKETNYLLHRISNSIVIIDELQAYTPALWDKIIYFLGEYAKYFNIRFIIMSATLPKIDVLSKEFQGTIIYLNKLKKQFFTNNNFAGRVKFNFDLLKKTMPDNQKEKEKYLQELADFMLNKSEKYANNNNSEVSVLIEFITKKSASEYLKILNKDKRFSDYEKLIISGEILEPRRHEIIELIKNEEKKYNIKKMILVSTQVVEAGVDIDMDIGFKDRSLIDSDEQLAGRINRNASKSGSVVYLFNLDNASWIYKNDERLKVEISDERYSKILNEKNFDDIYTRVNKKIIRRNNDPAYENLNHYLEKIEELNFDKIHKDFKIIDNSNFSMFIPVLIDEKYFTNEDKSFLNHYNIRATENKYDGKDIFELYKNLKLNPEKLKSYIDKQIELKQLSGIMSKFMLSVFDKQKETLNTFFYHDEEVEKLGILYLLNWENIYSLNEGFTSKEIIDKDVFL